MCSFIRPSTTTLLLTANLESTIFIHLIFKREHRYALLATMFFLPDDFPKILGDFFALELKRKVSLQLFFRMIFQKFLEIFLPLSQIEKFLCNYFVIFPLDYFHKILSDLLALKLNRKVSLQLFRHFSP